MKTIIISILCMFCFIGCSRLGGTYVEQEVRNDCGAVCKSGHCFVTYVWYKMKIVKSWYDDVDSLSDSLINERKLRGEAIIDMLKGDYKPVNGEHVTIANTCLVVNNDTFKLHGSVTVELPRNWASYRLTVKDSIRYINITTLKK